MTRDELLSRLERMRDALRDRASDLTADVGSWREMSDRTGGATAAKLVKDALENEAQAAWLQEQADALDALALSEARAALSKERKCIACTEGNHALCLGGKCECIHEPGEALEGQGWQPIETAPKDEPLRLFARDLIDEDFNPSGSVEGYWQDGEGWIGAVWDGCHDTWNATRIEPSHWMALPGHPEGA